MRSLFWMVPVLLLPTSAFAQTTVSSGNLVGTNAWSTAGSPYILSGDLTVPSGSTLTIQAGVEVRFLAGDDQAANLDTGRTELRIAGTLQVNGTASDPVELRSGRASPSSGDYYGLVLLSGATVNASHLTVRHGHRCLYGDGATGARFEDVRLLTCERGAEVSSGGFVIVGGEVGDSQSDGLLVQDAATLQASNLHIHGAGSRGLYAVGATRLSRSLVEGSTSYGIYTSASSGSRTHTLERVTVVGGNSYGIYLSGSSANQTELNNSIVANNRTYGVYRGSSARLTEANNLIFGHTTNSNGFTPSASTVVENPLFVDAASGDYRITSRSGGRNAASDGGDIGAFAFDGAVTNGLLGHLFSDLTLSRAGSPHAVLGDLVVEPGVTLTLEAGATLTFPNGQDGLAGGVDTQRAELQVQGRLLAAGTAAQPIVFGDPNGADRHWYGLILESSANGVNIEHARIHKPDYGFVANEVPTGNRIRRTEIDGAYRDGGLVNGGAVQVEFLTIHGGRSRGLYVRSPRGAVAHNLIYDNASYGLYVSTVDSASWSGTVHGNTVVDNNSYGIYVSGGSNLNLTLRDNIVAGNRTYGIYKSSSARVSDDHNLVWDQPTNYSNVSPGPGSLSENPLFVDAAGRDYRITSNSPARLHAAPGDDMGALPYDGVPTAGLVGHLYADTLLTQAGSPHAVLGDLVVEPNVTLTIEPGTELRFAAGNDLMRGGSSTQLGELRVLGRLVADGTASRGIRFVSDAPTPSAGDWYGVLLLNPMRISAIDYAEIAYGHRCLHSEAPTGTLVQRSELHHCQDAGVFHYAGGTTYSELRVHDIRSRGIYLRDGARVERCQVYDNASYGIYNTSSGANATSQLVNNTVVDNNSYGIYLTGSSSLRVELEDNIIVGNRTYGIYVSSSPRVSLSHNLLFDQPSQVGNVSLDPGSRIANPLFLDRAQRDFRIGHRSPARNHASDGSDIGALPWTGDLTVGWVGHLYADEAWSGTVDVLGDVVVEPGVTLSVAAGTTINFPPTADQLGSGTHANRSELRILGRLQVNGTASSKVQLQSGAVTPGRGDWTGLRLESSAANSAIRHARIAHAQVGLWSQAPASASITQSEIELSDNYGVEIRGGALELDGVNVHANDSNGLYVTNSSPTLRNLVIADNGGYGVYVSNGSGSYNVTLDHLTLDANRSYGVYVSGNTSLQVAITNSSITNNRSYGIRRSSSARVTLGRNNVWMNGTDYSGVSAGSNSLSTNPNFVNAATGNYQLQPTSTLIDAADPASRATSDFDGTTRPLDGDADTVAVADLGAYEFNPSTNRFPTADAGPDRVVTSGVQATFDGTGSTDADGTIATYAWDFGDGTTGTGAMVNHTFSGGTDRTVTLTVTDNAGAQDVDTVFVEVNLPPTADAGPARFGDPLEIISFDGTGSTDSDGNLVSHVWDFGDGTGGGGATVSHAYTSAGTYTVILTVTDDDGATHADTTTVQISGTDLAPPMISHSPVPNGRPGGQAVTVSAMITDASGVGAATLYYRAAGTGTFASTAMSPGAGSTYSGTIPGAAVGAVGVEYYIAARDTVSPPNAATQPSNAPTAYFTFTVVAQDTTPPTIAHVPVANGQPEGVAVSITAAVSDPSGVGPVQVHYRPATGGSFTALAMSGSGTYSASIPAAAVTAAGIEYYIEAADQASTPNSGTQPPNMGVYAFTVLPSDTAPPSITHSPISGGQPAGTSVMVSAQITDSSGVGTVTLYYRTGGSGGFASVPMAGAGATYQASLPAAAVAAPSVDYYIEATDQASPANTGVHPVGAPGTPHRFSVMRVFDLSAGDIIVTEMMVDPSGTESEREWFELYNTTSRTLDLDGVSFADSGSDGFVVDNGGPLTVAPGGYLVFARSGDSSVNGGVTADYVYSGMALANTTDEIILAAGPLEVDRVEYDAGANFPRTPGYALSLDPALLTGTANDPGAAWCLASSPLSGGDYGTPGQANDACPDLEAPVITHTPIGDGQPAAVAVVVTAVVTDDTGLDGVSLHFREVGAAAFTDAAMTPVGGDVFQAEIPASSVTLAGIEYYLSARDQAATPNEAFEPMDGAAMPHHFMVTTDDTSGPSLTHEAWVGPVPEAMALPVVVSAVDSAGVAEVVLHYASESGAFSSVVLTEVSADRFEGTIPAGAVQPTRLRYYLEAEDGFGNTSALPEMGADAPFEVEVRALDEVGPSIVHTPPVDPVPANRALSVSAEVSDSSGVDEVRLYFRGPGGGSFASVAMSANGDTWSGTVPAPLLVEPGVEYYLEAVDAAPEQNASRAPAAAPAEVFMATVEAEVPDDTEPPTLLHIAPRNGQPEGQPLELLAEVSDPSGVASVVVHWRAFDGAEFSRMEMSAVDGSSSYRAVLPADAVKLPGVEYYLEATDTVGNAGLRPSDAPAVLFQFTVETDGGGGGNNGGDPAESGGCVCVQPRARSPWPLGLLLLGGLALARRRRQPLGG